MIVQSIEDCIANGRPGDAIALLMNFLRDRDRELYGDVLILSGRFNGWQGKKIRHDDDDPIEFAKICDGIIFLADKIRDMEAKDNTIEDLFDEKRRYDKLISQFPFVVFDIVKGVFVYSRGEGLRNFGLSDNQIVGASLKEVYQNSHPDFIRYYQKCLSEQRSFRVVVDGFVTQYSPIFDDKIQIQGVNGIAISIHDMKEIIRQAEQEQVRAIMRELERDDLVDELNAFLIKESIPEDLRTKLALFISQKQTAA